MPSGLLAILRDGIPRTRAQLAELTGLARSTVVGADRQPHRGGPGHGGGRRRLHRGPAARAHPIQPRRRTSSSRSTSARPTASWRSPISPAPSSSASRGASRSPTAPSRCSTGRSRTAESSLRVRPPAQPHELVGVGIGVPGPVEHSTGTPVNPPIMPGWDRFDIPAYVRRRFDVPVLVDNDVNLLALGEHAMVYPERVRSALRQGRDRHRRRHHQRRAACSAARRVPPAISVTSASRSAPTPPATALRMRTSRRSHPVRRSPAPSPRPASRRARADDVVTLARTGNPAVLHAIRQAGRDLGEVVATCVNLLNPSLVVVGGSLSRVGEQLLAGVREVVYQRSTPLATQYLTITQSRSGETRRRHRRGHHGRAARARSEHRSHAHARPLNPQRLNFPSPQPAHHNPFGRTDVTHIPHRQRQDL